MRNYGKTSRGRPFKKGERPWNTQPVGTERLTATGFIQVKIAQPGSWKLKHLVVWEKAHGPVPEGHKIDFIDGDRQNVRLENLKLVPTAALIGEERLGSNGLIEVKIADRRWRPKHVLIWEAAHGSLPKTHVLHFIDGDKSNCALANLFPFPKNGRLAAVDLAGFGPGSGLEAFGLSLELLTRLERETGRRAAVEAMKINDELLLAQLEYFQIIRGGSDAPYRH